MHRKLYLARPLDPQVRFTSGNIKPDEGQDLDAWRKVIGVVDDSQKKGLLSGIKESAAKLLLKVGLAIGGNRQA